MKWATLFLLAALYLAGAAQNSPSGDVVLMEPFKVKSGWFRLEYRHVWIEDSETKRSVLVIQRVFIREVIKGSAAEKAGLRDGMEVLEIQGVPAPGHPKLDFVSRVLSELTEDSVKIRYWERDKFGWKRLKTITVPIERRGLDLR